ncbi:hypothetical protein PINS_up004372 [Pythium insidiosum]|nr:hypothetical protein PINS_up004372 [Pythium insidiosum]
MCAGLLRTYKTSGRPQGFTRAKLRIAVHVARALTYLHSLDPVLLHRDLKSKNILLTEDGDAKVTDFGVAREWEDLTMTEGVGSLLWMAPEIVQGERYNEKADIYSVGVVLSELDTNELPFSRVRHKRPETLEDKRILGDGDDRVGEAASGEWLSDLAICQLVSSGELSVSFSESCDSRIESLGRECIRVDARDRPSATEVLHRLHQLWWEK